MVFQKPTPFPMSIYDNIAFGIRLYERLPRSEMDGRVETSLRRAALWDEVKDKLSANGLRLSGGQQQRLCIARTVASQPEVILLDEPCSALDPISTAKIEELIDELTERLHDRDRHPQHAAGGARLRLHRLHVSGRADRVRRHRARSSPRRAIGARRTTSPAASARGGQLPWNKTMRSRRQDAQMAMTDHTVRAFDVELPSCAHGRGDGRPRREAGGRCARCAAERLDRAQRTVAIDRSSTRCRRRSRKGVDDDRAPPADGERLARDHWRTAGRRRPRTRRRSRQEYRQAGDGVDGERPARSMLGVKHMGEMVLAQLKEVLDAYAHRDLERALAVWNGDEELDASGTCVFRELLTYMMEDPRNITFCAHLLFCSKNIERMGDHATNIAETVDYLVTGSSRQPNGHGPPGNRRRGRRREGALK